MKKVLYFAAQRAAIEKATNLIGLLPPDTQWMLSVTEQVVGTDLDAVLNVFVLPGEVNDYRLMLGLSDYSYKEADYITYDVDGLDVSIIELEDNNV